MSAVDYIVDGKTYEGWFEPAKPNAPVVVVVHAWGGLADNERRKAKAIVEACGYAAFAIDVYGKGRRGSSPEENQALMNPMLADRAELQTRLAGGIAAAKAKAGAAKAAAIGYCFGGLCVLDMARAGLDVTGVASFHGLFHRAPNIPKPKITAKVLVEHGWQDPMATPADVLTLAEEMVAAGADWRMNAHGRAVHAFTTQGAANRAGGVEYDADADRRSFASLKDFLSECL
jgi:dienelactone hydrolase